MHEFMDHIIGALLFHRSDPRFQTGQNLEGAGTTSRHSVENLNGLTQNVRAWLVAGLAQQAGNVPKRHGPQPAGLAIIGHINQCARRGRMGQTIDECSPHRRRNPAIDAMQCHIVEPPEFFRPVARELDKIAVTKIYIVEACRGRDGTGMVDMIGQEVHAHKITLWIGGGQQA